MVWGILIGVALVGATLAQAFEFPDFRMPFTLKHADTLLVSAFLFGIVVSAYRKLWKFPSFWALLVALLGAHVALYGLFIQKIADSLGGISLDAFYGIASGCEIVIFALLVACVYHRGPDADFLTGRKVQ